MRRNFKNKVTKLLAVSLAATSLLSTPVFADEVVQNTAGTVGATEDSQYPLAHLKDWFVTDERGRMTFKADYDYIEQQHPELELESTYNSEFKHYGVREYIMQTAINEQNPTSLYLPGPAEERVAIAKLAGVYPAGYEYLVNDERVLRLEQEIRNFMGSFDWEHASDFEKAVRVSERVNQATYTTTTDNCHIPYGCLVEGYAACDGYAEAANLLGFCVDVQTSLIVTFTHVKPVYFVNGVWLMHEPTTKDDYFVLADYTVDMYTLASEPYYGWFSEYCVRTGYQKPATIQEAFPNANTGGIMYHGETNQTIKFH